MSLKSNMDNFIRDYFKDYTNSYTLIGGIPTSPFGTSLAKRCAWCYSIIYTNTKQVKRGNEDYLKLKSGNILKRKFCSNDCKEEYSDWSYFRRLRYQRERTSRIYHSTHKKKIVMNRKEYLKQYYLDHKEKKQKQYRDRRIKKSRIINLIIK